MTLSQFVVAAGVDRKWLLNSSELLGRTPRYTPAEARWWGMVRMLSKSFGLQLKAAAAAASRALATGNDARRLTLRQDPSGSATLSVDTFRYSSVATANLSRALVRETPRRRGRRAGRIADPIAHAVDYGIDVGLMKSALERTPAERLAMLEANKAFVDEMQRARRMR